MTLIVTNYAQCPEVRHIISTPTPARHNMIHTEAMARAASATLKSISLKDFHAPDSPELVIKLFKSISLPNLPAFQDLSTGKL